MTLSVPDEGYSRNTPCTLHLISTFFLKRYIIDVKKYIGILINIYIFFYLHYNVLIFFTCRCIFSTTYRYTCKCKHQTANNCCPTRIWSFFQSYYMSQLSSFNINQFGISTGCSFMVVMFSYIGVWVGINRCVYDILTWRAMCVKYCHYLASVCCQLQSS